MRKEQSGDANVSEKTAMRSVLGALGYLARESRPDLSEPVSIQVSDIQETNRVVRLAKARTDLALPICRIPVDQICLVSYGDTSGGGTHAEQARTGYVIMFADMSLLAGLASPVTRFFLLCFSLHFHFSSFSFFVILFFRSIFPASFICRHFFLSFSFFGNLFFLFF